MESVFGECTRAGVVQVVECSRVIIEALASRQFSVPTNIL